MFLNVDIEKSSVKISADQERMKSVREAYSLLTSKKIECSGWVDYPHEIDDSVIQEIKKSALDIKKKCTLFVVIGIGGSYLGARAIINAMEGKADEFPEVVFAGNSMSAAYLNGIVRRIEKEATCLCIISKSGKTVEPLLAYSILKDIMIKKYGLKEATKRIYVVTNKSKGVLREEANHYGYISFEIPDDICGRYSVLTPVGLLPVAVAGYDIKLLLNGAKEVCIDKTFEGKICNYVVARNKLFENGRVVEIFEYFEMSLRYFGEWLQQLFAESEGKDGKGVYPTCLCFSRDLHSVGQFLQQGRQIFYETMIRVEKPNYDFIIPQEAGEPLAGKTLEQINACSEEGVIRAHNKAEIPIILISISKIDEYSLGGLIYFFEMSCAISAIINGVNPFDQPGVDEYKREMKKLIYNL